MRQIVERWKALGRLDRKTDDALWTRIAAARSTVQRRRRLIENDIITSRGGLKFSASRNVTGETLRLAKRGNVI